MGVGSGCDGYDEAGNSPSGADGDSEGSSGGSNPFSAVGGEPGGRDVELSLIHI